MRLLHAVEVERCVVGDIGFDNLCSEKLTVVGSMVAEEELGFGTLFHHDKHATVYHQRHIGAQYVDDLHRAFHTHVLLHTDEEPVLRQHGVECGDGIIGC